MTAMRLTAELWFRSNGGNAKRIMTWKNQKNIPSPFGREDKVEVVNLKLLKTAAV